SSGNNADWGAHSPSRAAFGALAQRTRIVWVVGSVFGEGAENGTRGACAPQITCAAELGLRSTIMRTVIVTGSAGLIGSETVKRFAKDGMRVVGIDNDMREKFFGAEASTKKTRDDLIANVRGYEHHDIDIRDASAVLDLFKHHRGVIQAVVHAAAQ